MTKRETLISRLRQAVFFAGYRTDELDDDEVESLFLALQDAT